MLKTSHCLTNSMKKRALIIFSFFCVLATLCYAQTDSVVVGAARLNEYLPMIHKKRVALFSNHTGLVEGRHTLDVLLEHRVKVTALFSPEHGFRGNADAGEHVSSGKDPSTGVPIYSLYDGRSRYPSQQSMKTFDVLLVDIQDVGLRYYTYYISMMRLMEACARYGKKVVVLDRPNPNGMYVDGPILDMKYKSGVGLLPIPVVHGLTLGELARMAIGEHWLDKKTQSLDLKVIPCLHYTHGTRYTLPVAPSPNLPDMKSVYLYPSLCYFEGTVVSLGRGTDKPFRIYGHPGMVGYSFNFTPKSVPGAKNPPLLNKLCFGVDLSSLANEDIVSHKICLDYVINAYRNLNMGEKFFTPFFEKLIGVSYVRTMIMEGKSSDEIRSRWNTDVEKFKELRKPYLLYSE